MFVYQKGGRKYSLTGVGGKEFILENKLTSFHFQSNNNEIGSFLKEGFDNTAAWNKISGDVMPLEPIEIERKEFEKDVGKYQVKGAFVFEDNAEGGKMNGSGWGYSKELLVFDTDKFFAINSDIKIEFVRDNIAIVAQDILVLPMKMKVARLK